MHSSWSGTTLRTSSPRRCRTCFLERRSHSVRRLTRDSITISRRRPVGGRSRKGIFPRLGRAGRGPFPERDPPAIEEETRRIIAAEKPLVREVWDRARVRQFFLAHGEA